MRTAQGSISGGGTVDLPNQTLDWNLSVADDIEGAKTSQLTEQDKTKVSIRGPLLEPTIRRADRPTLGEGALQTALNRRLATLTSGGDAFAQDIHDQDCATIPLLP